MSAAETGETGLKRINQEYRHYDKKMAHFLFDFRVIPCMGVSNRTDDECDQQVATVELC